MLLYIQVLILLALHQSQACSNDNRLIFSEYYNEADAPTSPNTKVDAGWNFKSFDAVDDSQKTFTFTALIHFKWKEIRIQMKPEFNSLRKPRTFLNAVWSPTLKFIGQVDSSEVNTVNNNLDVLIRNEGNDSIWIETRFSCLLQLL